MKFEVISLEEVRIDGVPAGKLVDVVVNYPTHVAAIYAAAADWWAGVQEHVKNLEDDATNASGAQQEAEKRLATVVESVATIDTSGLSDAASQIIEQVRSDRVARRRAALLAELQSLPPEVAPDQQA